MNLRKFFTLFAISTLLIIGLRTPGYSQATSLRPTGFVNDFANIIDSETKSNLSSLLTAYETATGNEIAVVTTPSLNELTVDDYAVRLFEKWGIGKKGKDNGLLILVAPNEKKVRIEVGYGLEGAINDALAGRIIDNTMLPWFREGKFAVGILNGTLETIRIINQKYGIEFDISKVSSIKTAGLIQVKKQSVLGTVFKIIGVIFIIILFIKNPWAALFLLSATSGRGGNFKSGGFGGGGFGGFGGGMSGGGGASRGW